MTEKEKSDTLELAIFRRGEKQQLIKALEELSELSVEIAKAANGDLRLKKLTEEIADAEIMIEQVKRICGADAAMIEQFKDYKIHRLSLNL
ncbi:MAG: hypothetical protein AB7F32_04985 [Victivallaceae bacterium]